MTTSSRPEPSPPRPYALLLRSFQTAAAAAYFLLLPCAVAQQTITAAQPPAIPRFGGTHEFGVLVGYSPFSGPIWGYDQNVRYLPVVLRYSYLISQHRTWSLRYAPELTPLSVLYEGAPSTTNPAVPAYHFGGGFAPEGFQIDYLPTRKAQPFLSNNGGFLYYADRVLSPQGSQWMFNIDFGVGVNLFVKPHQAVTFGYRYQHLSNANISVHNPGTDADIFYIGFSRFHTHASR